MEDFNAYTINQLRMILKELNINASGKKVNLIEKIKQYKYKDYNICFFDTETTGVTSNDYIIQCTLIIYNIYLDNEKEYNFYIKPNGFIIRNSHIHGITMTIANKRGIYIGEFFNQLRNIFKENKIQLFVAHNIQFDIKMLISEFTRHNQKDLIELFNNTNKFCTMKYTKNLVNAKDKLGRLKFPTLKELYIHLFNVEPTNLHDALYDTKYLKLCFCKLYEKITYYDINSDLLNIVRTLTNIEQLKKEHKLNNHFAIAQKILNQEVTLNNLSNIELLFYSYIM